MLKGEMPAQSLNKAEQDVPTGLLLDDRNPPRVAPAKVWGGMGEGSCCYYSWKDPEKSGKLGLGDSYGWSGTQKQLRDQASALLCLCACFPHGLPPSSFLLLLSLPCPVSLSCLVSVTGPSDHQLSVSVFPFPPVNSHLALFPPLAAAFFRTCVWLLIAQTPDTK